MMTNSSHGKRTFILKGFEKKWLHQRKMNRIEHGELCSVTIGMNQVTDFGFLILVIRIICVRTMICFTHTNPKMAYLFFYEKKCGMQEHITMNNKKIGCLAE